MVQPHRNYGKSAVDPHRGATKRPHELFLGRTPIMLETPRVVENGNIGPVNSAQVPRYSGESTFALLPRLRDLETDGRSADIKIIGAPFDTGVSYRPGARFGPSHVRQSSRLLRPYNPATDTSPFAQVQVADAGDMALNPFNTEAAIAWITDDAQ